MSKFKKEDFAHVNDALVKKAQAVVDARRINQYSTSLIYDVHNRLFKLKEIAQNCPSCLLTRSKKIADWAEWWAKLAAPQPQQIQMPVPNAGSEADNGAGKDLDPVVTYVLAGGKVMTVGQDGLATIEGAPAEHGHIYFLENGGSVVTAQDGTIEPEATDYETLVAKYALMIGEAPESELATLKTTVEDSATRLTENELAIVKARIYLLENPEDPADEEGMATHDDEGGNPNFVPKQILLQKVNKDNYAAEGDPFFAVFTANEDDATKGAVTNAETEKAVAAGTYATEDTTKVLVVSVGGKGSYKAV